MHIEVLKMLNKLMYKFMNFMRGRYGNDALNQALIFACCGLLVLNIFIGNKYVTLGVYVLWLVSLYRMLSKQIYKRQQENAAYEKLVEPITKQVTVMKKQKADPMNKYYRCPTCSQIVRVPKGRGRIEIRCPKCQSRFEKRT
jgi:DNA-directed RNA polymerase subunit RPC12/RpoP